MRGGSVYGPGPLDEEPSALAVSAAGEAVLTSTGVTVYDTQFHALWHNDEAIGARRILLTDDGTVFVLYNSNARIFTARSAQSQGGNSRCSRSRFLMCFSACLTCPIS